MRNRKNFNCFATAIELLNAFDMMDVVDNILCIQTYSAGWVLFFLTTLVVSAFYLACLIGLIEEVEYDPQSGKILSSLVTPIFTDVPFTMICGHVVFH